MKSVIKGIKKAFVSLLNDDTSDYPQTQITYNEVTSDVYRMSIYGLSSHPPVDSLAITFSPSCREDDPVSLIDDPLNRFKELKPGEVVVGNYDTKAQAFFDEAGNINITTKLGQQLIINAQDGRVEVNSGAIEIGSTGTISVDAVGNVEITAPTVQINGNLIVTGVVTGQTDVVGGPASTSLSTHTHTISGGSSAGTTSPPNP